MRGIAAVIFKEDVVLSTAASAIRIAASACAFVTLLSASFDARAEKRVALVLGNNAYQSITKLERAVNDARAVSATLQTLGFQVQLATDVGRRELVRQLSTFMDQIEPGDLALLFYAGHGVEIRGANYILPTDLPPVFQGQESLLTGEAISTDKIISDLQDRGARATVFVLDACRDNPFKPSETRSTRSLGGARGLAIGTPPEGVFVLYSAGVGQSALDRMSSNDTDPNSVFTRIFLKEIQKKEYPMVAVAKSVQVAVRDLSLTVNHTQVPAYYDQIIGQLYLAGTGPASGNVDWSAPAKPPADATIAAQPPPGRPVFNNRAFSEYVSRQSQFARSEVGNPNAVAICDRLASYGSDVPDSRAPRVELDNIRVKEAVPACVAAIMQDPATPRLRAQMARALLRSQSKADNASGVNILLDLANDGYPAAMWRIGISYYSGAILKQDKRAAATWFRQAADKGLGVAMSDLAYLYESGEGVPKDTGQAARWFEQAAATGHPGGMRNFALVLDQGEAVGRNPKQAAEYLLTAFRMGSDDARKSLFELHTSWHTDTKGQVQQLLGDFGFYRGRTDGEFDADTFAALTALRSSNPINPARKP
jgi:hypothetical protein